MVIASTPAVQVVLEMGRTGVPQSSDPFSSGQVVGDGWGIASPKPDSDMNLPQIPSHINNNMTVFKISLFTSIQSLFTLVFLPFLGVPCPTRHHGGFVYLPPPRQLLHLKRRQLRRRASQLAAEGSAPGRTAALGAQALQQLPWALHDLWADSWATWWKTAEKPWLWDGIGSLFENFEVFYQLI